MPGANVVQGPLLSLPAGTTTGAGQVLDNTQAKAAHSIVIVGSAGISAGACQLQGSHDYLLNPPGTWVNLGTAVTAVANGQAIGNVADTPLQFIRANVSTTVTGGTVTVYIASA